nr:MAG: zinc ribbon domain-containing protein [Candidatus Methanoperedens sp.]
MQIKKSIKIPVHYDTTNVKMGILDRLTSRITYSIRQISDLIEETTKLDRTTLRALAKDSDIEQTTGLSYGFRDQCIDKVMWSWKSYKDCHGEWKKKVDIAEGKIESARDEIEKEKAEKSLQKLLKKEPSKPRFENKTSCRIDYRTGKVEWGKGKFSPLWIHISTLEKGNTIDIPLNPSSYHLNQLKNAEINDFEIVKRSKKYYVHISTTKFVEDKPISSIGGGDQGLNRTIAVVLLTNPLPREEHLMDAAKRELLDKYDVIVASLQEAEKWDKLREIRNKRGNVSLYCDWMLANDTAEFTEGSLITIGNTPFRQTQFRGNGMPTLRKRIGKWSYSRQRKFIALKRAERGYPTLFDEERNTSKRCHICSSMLTTRKWDNGYSWILCHSCGSKIDADFNAAYNMAYKVDPIAVCVYNSGIEYALQCRDDRLKVQMNMEGAKPHASA